CALPISNAPGDQREKLNALLEELKRLRAEVEDLRIRARIPSRVEVPAGAGDPDQELPGAGRRFKAERNAPAGQVKVEGEVVTLRDPRTKKTLWSANLGE